MTQSASPSLPTLHARTVASLAAPAVAGTLFEPLLGIIDVAMLGPSGPAALAAVGACGFAFMALMNLAVGLGQGAQAACARAVGAGSPDRARQLARSSLVLHAVVGVALLVFVWGFAPIIARAVSADDTTALIGERYLRARCLGAPFGALLASSRGIQLAGRRATTVMLAMAAGACVHIALNLLLIPGAPVEGGIPLAPARAALSSAAGSAVACALLFFTRLPFPPAARIPVDGEALKHLVRMGLPPALQGMLTALGYAAFMAALGAGGSSVQGAATVLTNLAGFGYLVAMGSAAAANTLVAQHLGARDVVGARRAIRLSIGFAFSLSGAPLLFALLAPAVTLSFLSEAPDVAMLATSALPFLVAGIAADQAGVVLMLSLVAAGRGGIVAAVQLGLHWLVLVPGAWWLASRGLAMPWALALFAGYRLVVASAMLVLARRTLRPAEVPPR